MSKPTTKGEAQREMQRRDSARGCLLVLVLEGAAVLGALVWGIGWLFELPALRSAGMFAFLAFTVAAVVVVGIVLFIGNTTRQRRLRKIDDPAERENPGETR